MRAHRLLERDGDLARLEELLRSAAAGRGGCIAVLGPAGIGKTSLLSAARSRADELGVTVLAARGAELERDFPYGVARQLFERPLRRLADAERAAVLEGVAGDAAPAVGLDTPGEAAAAPFTVVHGMYWLCANLAARAPLALLVDDLHWADAASLRFLAYLARRVGDLPVALVVGARPPTDDRDVGLVAAVTAAPELMALAPRPLSEAAVAELAETLLGRRPDPDLVASCHRAGGGNPFLCSAFIAAHADGTASSHPQELAALVVRRLGRLPAGALRLARAVAILGPKCDLRQAAALAGLSPEEAASAHAALAAQGVLVAQTPPDFVHPLVATAVREAIPAAERGLLHARAARLLHADGAASEVVATQLLAAEPAGETWAVHVLRDAARGADRAGAPAAAAVLLRRALREPPAAEERVALLRELADMELRAGDPGEAAEHLDAACRIATAGTERADVRRTLASAHIALGRYAEARAAMEAALRELPPDSDTALEVEADLVQMASIEPAAFAGGPPRRPGFRPAGATRGERAYLAALTTSTLLEGDSAEVVAAAGRAAVRAGVVGDHRDGSLAWNNVAYPLIFCGVGDVVAQVADAEVDRASERGSVVGSVRAHAIRGMLHLRRGAVREAVADARTAAVAGREAGMLLAVLALGVLVEALAAHGEPSEADEALAAFGLQGEIPVTFHGNWALHGRAWLRLAQDRPRDALADFQELGRRGERWRPWNPAMYPYRSGLALSWLRLGDRDAASGAAEEELRLARRFGAPVPIGVALRTAGLVAEGPAGLGLLRRSVDVLDGSDATLERARSLVELGAATRRAGHRARARDLLQEGMELAHRCAARPLAERAREELVATGARPRRMVRTGVDALTPSELRVARMAARGMTNREIAQALFVTGRTVETHLSHVYAKLDIASRDELAGSLPAVY